MTRVCRFHVIAIGLLALIGGPLDLAHSAPTELDKAIDRVKAAAATPAGTGDAEAWRVLATAKSADLPALLQSMKDASPLAENWLRAAVDAVADQALAEGKSLPVEDLHSLLADTGQSPRARRTAYELLVKLDPTCSPDLLAGLENDPSLELRYDAIELLLNAAKDQSNDAARRQALTTILQQARNLAQIDRIASDLLELGQETNLAELMGFITKWQLIGPFDHTGSKAFDVAYPPEASIDLAEKYPGKEKQVAWQPVETADRYAVVDVAKEIGPVKGAITYAYAEFESSTARDAEIRYASLNATKLWLNGELVAANEIYHSGGDIDQYRVPVRLLAGTNRVLLKVCQNEQTEPWAQDWKFQLRVCDALGGALDRPVASPAVGSK